MKKKYLFLLFLFLFPCVGFSVTTNRNLPLNTTYGNYNYSPTFVDKLKNVATSLYLMHLYNNSLPDNALYPVKIRYGQYYDLALFAYKNQQMSIYTAQSANCSVIEYYAGSTRPTCFINNGNFYKSNNCGCGYNEFLGTGCQNNGSCSGNLFPVKGFASFSKIGDVPNNLQTSNCYLGGSCYNFTPFPNSQPYKKESPDSYFSNRKNDLELFTGFVGQGQIVPIIPDSFEWGASWPNAPVQSDLNNVANNINNIVNDYLQAGAVVATESDIVSTATYQIIYSTNYYISYNVDLSSISLKVDQANEYLHQIVENTNRISSSSAGGSIDLSSVTSRQDRLYDFLKSTAGVDYSQFCSSCIINSDVNLSSAVYTTSTTIWGAYTDLENYFSTNFDKSIVWDCKFHFSTITFLGTPIVLGDVDLCENYGEYFNLLKALLRLGFIVSGCLIFYRGVM